MWTPRIGYIGRAPRSLLCVAALVTASVTAATSHLDRVAADNAPYAVPARLVDTRPGSTTIDGEHAGTGQLPADSTLDVHIAGRAGIPTNATTVVLNVTAVNPDAAGHLTVHPTGTTRPNASNVNYYPGHTTANTVIARIGLNGNISIYTHAATHLIVDIAGQLATSTYTPLTAPARLVDTRPGSTTIDGEHAGTGQLPADSTLDVHIAGRAGIPTNATTVVLNVTAVNPDAAGHLTVHPTGTTRPNASNVNYYPGHTTANTVIARIGLNGNISIYTHAATHLIVDIAGQLATSTYTPLTAPARLVDTRPGSTTIDGEHAGTGQLPADSTLDVHIAGRAGIPTNATTVVLNVTAVNPDAAGHLTVHPTGTTRPNASNVNYYPGHTTANTVIARIGLNGNISIYTHAATHLIVDIAGQLAQDPYAVDFGELIVGRWTGEVTPPDAWSRITDFWVEFRADGSYSAGSSGPTPAFYYGTNDDFPEKVYTVTGEYPGGQPGSGSITIVWAFDGQVGTTHQASLENIRFSEDGYRLQFEFWNIWSGRRGPIEYDLTRAPSSS